MDFELSHQFSFPCTSFTLNLKLVKIETNKQACSDTQFKTPKIKTETFKNKNHWNLSDSIVFNKCENFHRFFIVARVRFPYVLAYEFVCFRFDDSRSKCG